MQPRVLILSSSLDSSPRCVDLARPMTIGEVVAAERVPLALPTIAVLTDPAGNSRPVLRGEWHVRQVPAGHQLAFVPVPGRGALSQLLAAVAGIALAIFAPWAAGHAALAMGFAEGSAAFAIAKGAIAAGIVIAGQFIINRLLPPPSNNGAGGESVYTAQASNNQAMPLEPIPELFGRLRYPPPYASRPYSEYIDNDQYLYQLHCMSVGHVDVLRWEVADTLVWTKEAGFSGGPWSGADAEIEIIHPGEDVTLFPANVVTSPAVDGQQVPDHVWLGPFAVNPPGTEIDRIMCDYGFPLGLVSINKKGNGNDLSRTVSAQYQAIDNAGDPAGSWIPLFSSPHTAKSRTPLRFSRGTSVPVGRYQVRLSASDEDTSDDDGVPTNLNRVNWVGLRGYLNDFETPPDVTLIATKVKASEHLSREAGGQYMFTGQRHLPVWDSIDGWSAPVATRNPAWAAAYALKKHGYSDEEFDLGWLATYAGVWETREDRFDGLFDRRWSMAEALDAILHAGRAYHVLMGSLIGFVRDEPRLIRRMAFTPDTVVRGSIRRHDIWFSEDAPDHLEVVYLDAETWREQSVLCAIGAVGEDKPQQQPLFGITDHDHAWREGIFKTAENAYRRSFRTFQVEREGRMLVRGDAVVLHDPLLEPVVLDDPDAPSGKAMFARLDERDGDVLTLDREVEADPSETYHLLLRDKRGREWGPCLIDAIDGDEITLNAADRAVVEAQHGLLQNVLPDISRQEPAHVSLLAGDYRLFNGLVVEAKPVGEQFWEVTLVNDDQRVHAVDETEVIPSPWTPPNLLPPIPDAPVIKGLSAYMARNALVLELQAAWLPAPGADRYVAEISYDTGAAVNPQAANWTPVHDSVATRFTKLVEPQVLTLRVAGIGRLHGAWAYVTITETPEILLPDEVTDPLKAEVENWFLDMSDWTKEESPFHPLWQGIIQEGIDRVNEIAAERNERVADVSVLAGRQRELYETVKRTSLSLTDTLLAQKRDLVLVREELVSVDQSSRAYAEDVFNLAVGPGSALAERLTTIEGTALSNYNDLSGSITGVQSTLLDAIGGEASARAALRIQLVGEYTGNDIAQVTEGLLYQDRQAWISETQALSEAIDLISAGVGILFDWIDQWSFNTSVEGWTGNGTPTASGGWLRPANHATAPFVVSPDDLEMDGNAYRQIKLRIRKTGSPVWRGQFWWQGEADSTWDAGRRETITEPSYVDGVAVVTVDMGWSGQIDRLRIDLSEAQTANDYFEIDWVSVGRPSPGASQAQVAAVQSVLASQILAEVQDREALSVILTGLADPTGATLTSLTQGLIYDERTARVAGDGANLLLIQGLAAQIDDPTTGLDALAQVQSTMSGTLSSLGGTVSGHTSLINDMLLDIDDLDENKAGVGITDGLQAQIDQLGGGQSLSLLASAVRSLRLTVDRMALGLPDVWLSGKRDMDEMGGIVAQVHQEAISRIDITDEKVTLHGQIIDQINLNLAGKAGLDIVNALTGRVEATEGGIVSQGGQILSIQSALNGYTGENAVAVALSQRYTKTETDNEIDGATSALSGSIEDLYAALGGSTNQVRIKAEAMAGPSGYSRLAIVGRTTGFADRAASAFMDVPNNAAQPTRWAFQSDQFAILDGNGNLNALFDGNTAYLNNARVRNLTGDQMLVNGVHANVLQAGTLDASKWAPPAAGDNIIFEFLGGYEVASIFTDWPDVTHYPSFLGIAPGQGRIFGCNSRFAGSVRLRLFHYADNDGNPVSISSIVRVYRSGSQIQEWTTAALKGSPQHRVLDIAVSVGDNISVAHAKTSGQGVSVVGGVTIGSANITPAIY